VTERPPNTILVTVAGAAFGACGGAIVAYTTFMTFGLLPARWENFLAQFLWGGFVGLPFGVVIGASAGIFVSIRSRRLTVSTA
jgi:hypothetical protein